MLHTLFGKREEVNYKELVKDGAIIVDVRSREEYSIDHVKGSVNIPLDILPVSLDKLGGKNRCIIACCASGNRSGITKNALESLGYTNVHNGGGWHSLQKKLS